MLKFNKIGIELRNQLMKARSGIYEDTSENRRKHRVGQHYGSSSLDSEGSEGVTKREERLARLEKYKNQLAEIESKLSVEGLSEESRLVGEALKAKMEEKIQKLALRIGVKLEAHNQEVDKPFEEPKVPDASEEKPSNSFSYEELTADYDSIDSLPIKEKKALAEKYGSGAKADEIKRAILIRKRGIRNQKTEFSDEDLRDWSRLTDNPVQEKKFKEFADKETRGFLEFLKQANYNTLVKNKLVDKIPYASMRDWNYTMSWSDKYKIGQYLMVKKYLEEHTEDAILKRENKERGVRVIHEKLVSQTQDFKNEFVEKARVRAERIHEEAPARRDNFFKLYEEAKGIRNAYADKARSEGNIWYDRDPEYKSLSENKDMYFKGYRIQKAIAETPREEYVFQAVQQATDYFNGAMNELSVRIQERGVNPDTMTIREIDDDAKYFSLYIDDGIQNFYARSIWAATYSEKVSEHLRFIITTRKESRVDD